MKQMFQIKMEKFGLVILNASKDELISYVKAIRREATDNRVSGALGTMANFPMTGPK